MNKTKASKCSCFHIKIFLEKLRFFGTCLLQHQKRFIFYACWNMGTRSLEGQLRIDMDEEEVEDMFIRDQ